MSRQYLRLTTESTWGTYNSGGNTVIVQIDQNNAFTMRAKPVRWTYPHGGRVQPPRADGQLEDRRRGQPQHVALRQPGGVPHAVDRRQLVERPGQHDRRPRRHHGRRRQHGRRAAVHGRDGPAGPDHGQRAGPADAVAARPDRAAAGGGDARRPRGHHVSQRPALHVRDGERQLHPGDEPDRVRELPAHDQELPRRPLLREPVPDDVQVLRAQRSTGRASSSTRSRPTGPTSRP